MNPEPIFQPWMFYSLLGLQAIGVGLIIWSRNRMRVEDEIPPVEESPAMPKSVRDRLAARERRPKMTLTAIRKRREFARLVHGHDQEVAALREAQGAVDG